MSGSKAQNNSFREFSVHAISIPGEFISGSLKPGPMDPAAQTNWMHSQIIASGLALLERKPFTL